MIDRNGQEVKRYKLIFTDSHDRHSLNFDGCLFA